MDTEHPAYLGFLEVRSVPKALILGRPTPPDPTRLL